MSRDGKQVEQLHYISPDAGCKAQAEAFLDSFFAAGETVVNGSIGYDMIRDYDEWLAYLQRMRAGTEKGLGLGTPEVYFALNEKDVIVGVIDLRPGLPQSKREWGHVGYSVAPPHRRRGYARQMLAWGVRLLRQQGVGDILAACYDDNAASRKVLKDCGFLKTGSYIETETGKQINNYTNIKEKDHG